MGLVGNRNGVFACACVCVSARVFEPARAHVYLCVCACMRAYVCGCAREHTCVCMGSFKTRLDQVEILALSVGLESDRPGPQFLH